nr:hypothetical protein [Tanacetum cinerariifolium]
MEKDKRKKLKFPCIFGGNEEMLRRRNVQSLSLMNPTTKQSLIKFQVGKSTSKQRNEKTMLKSLAKGILNDTSAKKRPTSILAKLMGRDGLYSSRPIHKQEIRLSDKSSKMITMEQQNVYEDLEVSHPANQSHSLQPCTRMKKHINEVMTVQEDGNGLISGSNKTESNRHMNDSNSDLMLDLLPKPDPLFVKHLHDQKFQIEAEETRSFHDPLAHLSNKSSRRKLERKLVFDSDIPQQKNVVSKPNAPNGNCGDEILQISRNVSPSESDMITMTSRITMDQNDRLTHSLSNMSEPSLFMEAKNRMLERWQMTRTKEHVEKDDRDVGLVDVKHVFSSPAGLGIFRNGLLPSFNNENYKMKVYHEDDADDKAVVYSESRNDIASKKLRYNQRSESSKLSDTVNNEFGNYLPETHFRQLAKTLVENKSPVERQTPIYDTDNGVSNEAFSADAVTSCEIEVSSECVSMLNLKLSSCMVKDINFSEADVHSSKCSQVSGLASEYSGSIQQNDHSSQSSHTDVPPSEDVLSGPHCFVKLDPRLKGNYQMTTSSTNNSVFRSFFEKQKFTGPNYIDWIKRDSWPHAHEYGFRDPTNLEPLHAHEMLEELKTLFSQQAEHELLQTTRDFHSCKEEEGQSVSSYVLKMKGYIDNLERLGHPVTLGLGGQRASRKLNPGALTLYVGNGQREAVEAIAAFYLCLPGGLEIVLNNCHYAPSINRGVIYVSRFVVPRDGIFEIDLSNSLTNESFVYAVSNKRAKLDLDSALLWHCRLGYISKKCIEKLQHDGLLNSSDLGAFEKCVSCMSRMMVRKPYTHQVERAKDLLGLIHTDVCGPFKIMSRQGASYFVTFTDDFSRYGYVYLLKHKHEVFETFKVFQNEVENQLEKTIKSLCSDRGGEYMSQEFLDHLKDHGIIAHRTPPYTPQLNGVSERRNRTLLDMVRSMMSQITLPKSFWDYALETAARILNMVPTKMVKKTPYEVWHGKAPKLSYLKVRGCEALVKQDTLTKPDKLEPRSNQEASGSLEDLEIIQEEDTHPSLDISLNHEEDDLEIDEPQSDNILIRRSTRTQHAPDRMCLYIDAEELELGDLGEPANYKAALLDPESKKWINVMNVEMQSMKDNEVWVLVELPPNGKTVGSNWLFKKKTDMDGNVHIFKTRLVVKGYTQTPGIDYEETFSPVADIRAIRILIISAYYDYEI